MGGQPPGVVDLAARNDESHEAAIYLAGYGVGQGGVDLRRRVNTSRRLAARAMMRAMTSGTRDFTSIGVIGLGTMGAGIAEVFARNGYQVVGVEQTEESLKRGRQHVEHSTGRAVKRGKLTEDEQAELVGRITFTTDMTDVKDCGLVVEAVVEQLPVKQEIFRTLDGIVARGRDPRHQHLVALGHRDRHRDLPPRPRHRRALLQPGPGAEPRRDHPHRGHRARRARGRRRAGPVAAEDAGHRAATRPGFIANALLFGYLNHAASMFEGKYATREDLDAAMRFGCGYPMGPLALLDLIGLDTAYEILDTMYKQGRDRLHAPAPILKQMVTAGLLGRKSGRGFYTYEGPDSPVVVDDALTPSADDKPQLRHDIRTVGVVGTGTMATGIVEVFAKAGFPVTYVGRSDAKVDGRPRRRSRSRSTRRSSAASSRSPPARRCCPG